MRLQWRLASAERSKFLFQNWLVYAEIRKILTTNASTIDCFLWPEKQVHGVVYIKNRDKKSN